MIKDSKLIGTVITPPFGWSEFKVGDLFSVINSSGAIITENGGYPIVKAQSSNNGLTGKTDYYDMAYGLTIGMRGSFNVYIQEQPVALGANVSGLILKDEHFKFNKKVLLFLATEITTYNYKNSKGYENYPTQSRLSTKDKFVLPVTSQGEPDYAWMVCYLQELENEYLQELETYLQVSGLSDTVLSDEELNVLDKFRSGGVLTAEFKVGDLFDFDRGDITNRGTLEIDATGVDFVVQDVVNNGHTGLKVRHNGKIFKSGAILIGRQNGSVHLTSNDFVTTDGVLVLIEKNKNLISNKVKLFLVSLLNKQMTAYGFTNTVSVSKLTDLVLTLPVTDDGRPDYAFMEVFMRAQEKLSIQKLDTFRQQQIQVTKSVI